MRKIITATIASIALLASGTAMANSGGHKLMSAEGSYNGPFGKFDKAQLQRGYQIYKEVCSSCHSMKQLSFRNLGEKYAPYYDEKVPNPNENPFVKTIAKGFKIKDLDPSGAEIERDGLPKDKFPLPFASDAEAKAANGGALPPDLSVITKARHGGADYIYSLMLGYDEAPPKGKEIPEGKHYNKYMAGNVIGMAKQLTDDRVTYADTEGNKGVKATSQQEAKDIAAFLQWASDPHQTERKSAGVGVLIFLFILSIFTWFSYQSIWRKVGH